MASNYSQRALGILLSVLFATAAVTPFAHAEPTAADKETARNLMKEGDAKFAVKDYSAALKAYQAAHAIMQVPTTGLPLAKAQIEKGLWVEARDTLLSISRYPKEANEQAAFSKARDEAAQLSQKLIDRIPQVIISIEGASDPSAVTVQVDGAAIPNAALGSPRKVNPGSHVISASASGFKTATANVSLSEGESEKVSLKMVVGEEKSAPPPPAGAPPKNPGTLVIESPKEPGNVIVDGKAMGATPLSIPVEAGVHKVEIEYPGGTHEEKQVEVKAGQKNELRFEPLAMDAIARYRKGLHFGANGGLWTDARLEGGSPRWGFTAGAVMNIGITPSIDFRTGLSATGIRRFDEEYATMQISAVVPAMLRLHWSPWFSSSVGLSAGVALDTQNDPDGDTTAFGFSIGPEWTVLTLCAGEKREFELSYAQGLRFGDIRQDFHQSLVFTYLFLD